VALALAFPELAPGVKFAEPVGLPLHFGGLFPTVIAPEDDADPPALVPPRAVGAAAFAVLKATSAAITMAVLFIVCME